MQEGSKSFGMSTSGRLSSSAGTGQESWEGCQPLGEEGLDDPLSSSATTVEIARGASSTRSRRKALEARVEASAVDLRDDVGAEGETLSVGFCLPAFLRLGRDAKGDAGWFTMSPLSVRLLYAFVYARVVDRYTKTAGREELVGAVRGHTRLPCGAARHCDGG